MNKKFLIIPVFILLVIGGVLLIKKRKAEVDNLSFPYRPSYVVKGYKVKEGKIELKRSFIGKLEADNIVNISTKIPAYIREIKVKEGDVVRKGQTLAVLDNQPVLLEIKNIRTDIQILKNQLEALKSQKEALETAFITAKNIYERNKRLYNKKAISKEQLEISETEYKKSKASYENILKNIRNIQNNIRQKENLISIKKNQLTYLSIKAPIDGKVDKIFLKAGNLAPVGKPILRLVSNDKYKILFSFPNNLDIREGSKVYLKFGKKNTVKAEVLKVYPQTDKNYLNLAEVRVNSVPENIKSGSLINLEVVLKELKGKKVPVNSLLELSNGSYLLTIKNNKFVKIPVKVLGKGEKFAIVEGNIHIGTPVAVAEENKLRILITGKSGRIVLNEDGNTKIE